LRFICVLILLILTPIKSSSQETSKAFKKYLFKNKALKPILKQAQNYKIQIVYTPIEENKIGETQFFNYSPEQYFYPASTVKLPAVLLALEKLNHIGVSKDAIYASNSELESYPSVSPEEGETIANYIKKILLVSDNDAFNRLYDFLGQDYFNEQLKAKEFTNSHTSHRLSISLSPKENAYSPEVQLGTTFTQLAQNAEASKQPLKPILIGKTYYNGDELVSKPMDFAYKNSFDLLDQHKMLLSLFYGENPFNIPTKDLAFVKDYMSKLPRNAGYSEETHPDNAGKFFIFGDKKGRIPEHIKIYNKIGGAYGFLIDNAFIEDTKSNVKFALSAVIYTNANETLNDDTYEYNSVGLPFLGELGRHLYKKMAP
jgi:hypothetical protein